MPTRACTPGPAKGCAPTPSSSRSARAGSTPPRLADLVGATGGDELLIGTSSHDRKALFDSHRRLAELTGLPHP
ncbi:hypothetical protein [Glycomyces artemisiae]|uniref:hypothetical protein n=1 Tax=Glycomyces artemisiae TaxID=1076443 RepID=UPI001C6266CA|nr:hypothetical protein [Glycomyces artemisiae]